MSAQSSTADQRVRCGIITLMTVLPDTLNSAIELGRGRWRTWQWQKEAVRRLQDLTPDEKALLTRYVSGPTRTQTLDYSSGVTRSLVTARVIYQASDVGQMGFKPMFDYNIRPWAFDYLREHPEVLQPR